MKRTITLLMTMLFIAGGMFSQIGKYKTNSKGEQEYVHDKHWVYGEKTYLKKVPLAVKEAYEEVVDLSMYHKKLNLHDWREQKSGDSLLYYFIGLREDKRGEDIYCFDEDGTLKFKSGVADNLPDVIIKAIKRDFPKHAKKEKKLAEKLKKVIVTEVFSPEHTFTYAVMKGLSVINYDSKGKQIIYDVKYKNGIIQDNNTVPTVTVEE